MRQTSSSLGDRIVGLRELAGLTQGELAKLAGLSQAHLSLIESGKRVDIEASTAVKLGRAFGVGVEWLVEGQGDQPSEASIREALTRARAARDAAA